MAPLQDIFEGKIDFIGQKRVDSIARVALAACTIASFAAGYVVQSLRVTMGAFALSTLLVAVVCTKTLVRREMVTLSVSTDGGSPVACV
ncbi:hypothetical protein EDD17DRAFT_1630976 [Pisolithus thermaeus]|nr:hypothetical protein EDD17DRAFT_1630976 [Pisolithus thermaeus]